MLSFIRKQKLKEKEMRILMLGLDGAGKTTIVKRVMGEDVNTSSPTLGFIIKTHEYRTKDEQGNENTYRLNIWDIGGQRTLRSYWRNYFEKTDALVWVVDTTDRLRIDECRDALLDLLKEERLMGASLLIFANKSDVRSGMTEQDLIQKLELRSLKTHIWKIMESSAMTGKNVAEGIKWLVDDARERMFLF